MIRIFTHTFILLFVVFVLIFLIFLWEQTKLSLTSWDNSTTLHGFYFIVPINLQCWRTLLSNGLYNRVTTPRYCNRNQWCSHTKIILFHLFIPLESQSLLWLQCPKTGPNVFSFKP